MTTLHAHFDRILTPAESGYLREALMPDIQVTEGPQPPDDTDILIAGRPTREQLAASPHLRALIVPFAGVSNHIISLTRDFPHVSVHNMHHNAVPVAETAVMLLLAASKFAVHYDHALRSSDWHPQYARDTPAVLLHGKTALILGYGAIGRHVAGVCRALGMTVLATRRRLTAPVMEDGVEIFPADALPDLLPRSNAVIVCLPQTPETTGLLGAAELAKLPERSVLVNIGRGRVVDESALYNALLNGPLCAAGIDVWYNYAADETGGVAWPPSAYPFHELDNVIMSPHRADATDDTPRLLMTMVAGMLNDAAAGRIMANTVDMRAGY